MRFILLLVAAAFLIAPASTQPLLIENFDYPVSDLLTTHGWLAHSGAGSVPLAVTDNNLTFTDYPSSTGNSTFVQNGSGSREDAHIDFTPASSGSVYSALLINGSDFLVDGGGNYFFHLANPFPTTTFRGRIWVRGQQTGAGLASDHLFQIGISKGSNGTVWDATIRTTGTTYLLVMKYTFNAGASDDTVDLYIFEDGDDISVEPGAPVISSVDVESDLPSVENVTLRQSGDVFGLTVDGIRVGTTWADVVQSLTISCAPVSPPIVIPAAGGSYSVNRVLTNNTAAEVAFDFWLDIDGPGVDRTNGPHSHTIAANASHMGTPINTVPGGAPAGEYTYTCNVGTFPTADASDSFTFTKDVCAAGCIGADTDDDWTFDELDIVSESQSSVALPNAFVLNAAYPNPFNPAVTLSFEMPESAIATLVVYDAVGREVTRLVEGRMEAGHHEVTFDASSLPSGVYFARFTAGNGFAQTQRLTLLK